MYIRWKLSNHATKNPDPNHPTTLHSSLQHSSNLPSPGLSPHRVVVAFSDTLLTSTRRCIIIYPPLTFMDKVFQTATSQPCLCLCLCGVFGWFVFVVAFFSSSFYFSSIPLLFVHSLFVCVCVFSYFLLYHAVSPLCRFSVSLISVFV